jgi:hypothetical protein
MYSHHGILNPEFLSILNPRAGPRKILFHANKVDLRDSDAVIQTDFAQFICARQIFLDTKLIDEPCQNLFKLIMGTGNALEKVYICIVESNQGEFCEFIVKVNFDHFLFFVKKNCDLVYDAHGNQQS